MRKSGRDPKIEAKSLNLDHYNLVIPLEQNQ
jgi:hypothetical protein